jgi:hypothetical protein
MHKPVYLLINIQVYNVLQLLTNYLIYQRLYVVFRGNLGNCCLEKIFTICTLENTSLLLDTTFREVKMNYTERTNQLWEG